MSSGKTETLGLSQWQPSDAFLMEEMNTDNRKIDAGIKDLNTQKTEFVKLKELTTTTGGVTQIDIDVSDISFGSWQYILFDVQVDKSAILRVNNEYYNSVYAAMNAASGTAGSLAPIYTFGRSLFHVCRNAGSCIQVFTVDGSLYYGRCGSITYGAVKSFNLLVSKSGDYFSAGNKFTVWGVK